MISVEKVIEIVKSASEIMMKADFEIEQKGNASDLVTTSDLAVQKYLQEELAKAQPESSFVGEENGTKDLSGKYIWIIDPIDGTSNFTRNLSLSVISVGLMYDGRLQMGVVYHPYLDDVYYAELGKGAYLNGKPIHVSDRDFAHSHLCSAMCLYNKAFAKPCFNVIEKIYEQSDDLRRLGTAALEMCELAAGRVELYFEIRLSCWDYAAASVILTEAGGYLEYMFNDQINLDRPMGIIAANNKDNFDKLKEIVYSEIPVEPALAVPERVLKNLKGWSESDARRDAGNKEPDDIIQFKNLVYTHIPHEEVVMYTSENSSSYFELKKCRELLLDLYKPTASSDNNGLEKNTELMPVIISVHGGGYFYGDKELYRFYCMSLAQRGYAVINFNYRLAPLNNFPAPLEDINSVCHWVVDNAKEYGLDTEHIYMLGDSAGAQLTAHYATIYSSPEYSRMIGITPPAEMKLKAVSLACGLYNIPDRYNGNENDKDMIDDYLGKTPIKAPIIDYLKYIDEKYPPAYVFSAEYDFLKPACEPMYELLKGRGNKCEMKVYGKEGDEYMIHVFHVDMKLDEAKQANDDQVAFFAKNK